MLIATATFAFCKKFKLPFTVILVIVVMLLSYMGHHDVPYLNLLTEINVGPELIIYLCLPTLIFESALNLDAKEFKENLLAILTLAIPGLVISTAIIGIFIYLLTPLDLIICLLIGSILSATDPVAVVSLFKEIGVPRRLRVLVEGESLVNDATAIVISKIIIVVLLTSSISSNTFLYAGYDFLLQFFGGIVIGLSVSVMLAYLIGLINDDPYIEITLVTVIAYLSFLLADRFFHVSGVMATLMAGIIMGGYGYTKITPAVASYLKQFLAFIAFVANIIIFSIVGLSTNIDAMITNWKLVLIVVITMLISRGIVVGSLMNVINYFSNADTVNTKYQTILWWGGLRGAIALAIVMSLDEIPEKEIISSVVIGAILFTLLFQGLSINKLISWLKLDIPSSSDRLGKLETELAAEERAREEIPELQKGGYFSLNIAKKMIEHQNSVINDIKIALKDLKTNELTSNQETQMLYLRCLSIEKNLYYTLFSHGHLTEQVYHKLISLLNSHFDIIRYHKNPLDKISRYDAKKVFSSKTFAALLKIKIFYKWIDSFRTKQLAMEYEGYWAHQQGSHLIQNYLQSNDVKETLPNSVIAHVNNYYKKININASTQLDTIAEEFPKFVASMQTQLAQRMILHAEYHSIEQAAYSGLIQESIAENMLQKIKVQLFKLQKPKVKMINFVLQEMIRKVPFFSKLTDDQARKIVPLFTSYTALPGEVIVEQNAIEDSLFLIARGVVRVVQKHPDGSTIQIATLIAGDSFGENSLLHHIKTTAACRAVTSCELYQLKRTTFEHICSEYHDIGDMIREIDRKRRLDIT